MRIDCPACGPRDLREFVYLGDALRLAPALDASLETWSSYVYERKNTFGPHAEHWQHAHGCRQVLRVERDTATHVVASVAVVGPFAAGET